MDAENAGRILDAVERWEERALAERGDRWVFGSDELYLLSDHPLPGAEHYGDFAQIENGVGAVAVAARARARRARRAPAPRGQAHRRRHRRLDGAADARAARCADASARARRSSCCIDGELALRPDDHHRRPPRRRRHPPRARRSPRPRSRVDPRRDDQRRRPLSRRRALHRAARDAAHARLSLVRLHRRARARGRAAALGGTPHERSGRRPHRTPERREVRAVQSHRRRRQRHRLRGGGDDARPPLLARRVERPRVLARGHGWSLR